MNNFFSGNNMANEIMQKTSPALQLKEYVHNYAVGTPIPEFHPERVDPVYETTKPFVNLRTPREEIVPIVPIRRHVSQALIDQCAYARRQEELMRSIECGLDNNSNVASEATSASLICNMPIRQHVSQALIDQCEYARRQEELMRIIHYGS